MPHSMNPNKGKTPIKGQTSDTRRSDNLKGTTDRIKKDERPGSKTTGMHSKGSSQGFTNRTDSHNKSK